VSIIHARDLSTSVAHGRKIALFLRKALGLIGLLPGLEPFGPSTLVNSPVSESQATSDRMKRPEARSN